MDFNSFIRGFAQSNNDGQPSHQPSSNNRGRGGFRGRGFKRNNTRGRGGGNKFPRTENGGRGAGQEAQEQREHPRGEPQPGPSREATNAQPRRGGAEMQQAPVPRVGLTQVDKTDFPIYVSNFGCRSVADIVYRFITARITRFAVTNADLVYVTQLAWLNRVISVNLDSHAFECHFSSDLKQAIGGVYFPEPIASFIESIGRVADVGGRTFTPFFLAAEDIVGPHYDPIVNPNGLPFVRDGEGNERLNIDRAAIARYSEGITRVTAKGLRLRQVDNKQLNGSVKMICSYVDDTRPQDLQLVPANARRAALVRGHNARAVQYRGRTPGGVSEADAMIAGAYQFREWQEIRDDWPGLAEDNSLITPSHSTKSYNPSDLLEMSIARVCSEPEPRP